MSLQSDCVDPDTLLEWLQTGSGDERDLQLMALEQLCMLLLMSDNIDRCFESCPPRTFIPALCRIFLDETATDNVLEVTSRAITYYLDVSNECTRRITQVEGAVKAICNRLYVAEMTDRTQKDLAEQCVKLLEHVCQRETTAVYEAGGLHAMLFVVRQHGHLVHKDTLYSAMSVVQRLCSRVEPQNPNIKECTIDLGELLVHEDQRVAESALRCFAALTDRYIRKLMNPGELAESSNLVEHLLDSLIPAGSQADVSLNDSGMSAVYGTKSASFVSIVLSLLSNLCRGSAQITLTVVSSPKLIPALRAALSNKDERCVLDSLRLADLLVILLCEGRQAFSRSNVAASLTGAHGDESSARLSYDRTHRYLIDIIRQRDTNALMEAVESGSVDPNFTDDVGQTLLNWCSAFGTIEMVNFLCEKGADVNCGQRSSSLHYAACFGRVDVIIALLQNGANPDLRDEDGRTALEKARERSDETHQQVVQILESPSDYMMLAKKKRTEDHAIELMDTCAATEPKQSEEMGEMPQIDLVIVRDVIQQLIPIFCAVFNDSLVASVRRATLSLIKKCIQYCPTHAFEDLVSGKVQLQDGTDDENSQQFVEHLMRVVVAIFNDESNLEGHMQVIMILKSLFEKNAQFWLEQLIRLGIVEKVEQLASPKNAPVELLPTNDSVSKSDSTEQPPADIFAHEPMDVSPAPSAASSILRSATSTPSIGLVSSESLRSQASGGTTPETNVYTERLRMLNVPIHLDEEMISDTETPPPTNEQSDSQASATRMDTSDLKPLATSTTKPAPILPTKKANEDADAKRQRVYELAKDLWDTYLKDAHNKPREVFVQLRQAAQELKDHVEVCAKNPEDFTTEEKLARKLIRVRDLIVNERLLSTFELASSGLIHALLALVREACAARQGVVFQTFYKVFDDEATLSSMIKRMVQVLEHVEKFNQCLYDTPGGSAFGLQLLTRRLRFTMQQHNPRNERQSQLLNRTGRVLKTEPLTTVGQLRTFLHRMVSKMWYDYQREGIFFVKELKAAAEKQQTVRLEYESDFDTNGLIWFLGTNAHTTAEWTNPGAVGLVQVWSSDGLRLPYGSVEDILSRDTNALNCHTSDAKDSSFTIDLGVLLKPDAYTLRHARGYGKSALRTWDFEGSEDGKSWIVLKRHQMDRSLQEPGSTATFFLDDAAKEKKVRFVRIQQRGFNSSDMTHYLSLSGFEIYGELSDVVAEALTVPPTEPKSSSSSRALRLQQQMFPPRPSGERSGKESKSKKSSSSGSKTGAIRLRKSGASSTTVPAPSSLGSNTSQLPLNLTNFVKFFESTSQNGLDESTPTATSPSSFVSAFGPGAYVTRQRLRPARPNTHSFASMNPATASIVTPPTLTTVAPTIAPLPPVSTTSNQLQQKSMSTTNLQDADGQAANNGPSVAATKQASSAETIGQLRRQSPSLENLLSRARLFVGTGSGLSQDRIPESVPENDALTDYESSLDAHSNNDLDSTQTLDDNGEQNASSRHLSASTPEESEHFVVDGSGSGSNSQQQLFGFVDTYQEMLRSSNIGSIEDVEFERAILSNCMPGGLLDEIADEDEMDSYSSDVPVPPSISTPAPSSSNTAPSSSSPANPNLLAFIDETPATAVLTATTGNQTTSSTMMSTNTTSIQSRLPMRHEIVQLLAEAAERHGGTATASVEIPTTTHAGTAISHDLVMSMLDAAGIRATLTGASSEALSAAALHHQNRSNTGGRNQRKPTRNWDDEYVLRRQYNSLLPAFDPRPGRNNVNQTQDVELPPTTSNTEKLEPRRKKSHTPTTNKSLIFSINNLPLNLYLCGPNVPGTPNVTVSLNDDDETIFAAVQRLFASSDWSSKPDKFRKVWELTYEIIYEYPPAEGTLNVDGVQCALPPAEENLGDARNLNVKQTLDVLKYLHELSADHASSAAFISSKLTQKLYQELSDSLVVAASAFPIWCETLVYSYPCLFSLETRNMFMRATAFGTSRAIVWLQNRRDQMLDEARGAGASQSSTAGARREDHYPEFRIGRIKHERIRVERSDQSLWNQAMRVLKYHSGRKSVLEIEFADEEGTGLGPTLEFYALVAAEFQRKSLGMWLCDDGDEQQQKLEADALDLGEGVKPPGYYVRRIGGLFPAPAPPNSSEAERISDLFRVLGIFLAKALQDGRLVDLPLSLPFLRLLISDSVAGQNDFDLGSLSLDGLLGIGDLDEIHQHKARFLRAVQRICIEKSRIRTDPHLSASEKSKQISALTLRFNDNQSDAEHECRVEDLALAFVVNPPSTVFNYKEHELIAGGAQIDVTIDNIELYLGKCVDFYLNSGIRQQIMAFREGFDSVFPLRSLKSFTAIEVQTLLSGEQCPEWTREDLLQFIEPKLGYTRDSAGFLYFVDVVAGMSASERKAFLQFTTGCSSLPPGGLANLHPRLTVVRKVDAGGDGSYPSVNTCVHYLKLPEYSSAAILKERLLAATHEKGFHLN